MIVALVSCGSEKSPASKKHPVPAKDLYTGGLFRQARAYAERHADAWLILSGKYGVLHPDDLVGWYDVWLGKLPLAEREAWGERVRRELKELGVWDKHIVLLGGKEYERAVEGAPHAIKPLAGLEMGYRRRWFKENT
jgi:cytoplasmic iron level regulating protein YaaA (DUF328/UPF0246 family)